MLLVHQAGSVKVGEVTRFTVTYYPANDRILPTPGHLHLKVKNTCAIPLRAAWIHGPYALHVATYSSTFNPHQKVENAERDGVPQYEPMLKAGGSWQVKLKVPEDIRETAADMAKKSQAEAEQKKSVTWIVEIASQIMFSTSASVEFEVLIGRDERSLDLGFAAVAGHGHGRPGQAKDVESSPSKPTKHKNRQSVGVYSKAIRLIVEDTTTLWNKPELPTAYAEAKKSRKSGVEGDEKAKQEEVNVPRKRKRIHLVVVTHGLHSNTGADMLFLKESIDATVKQAREEIIQKKKDRQNARNKDEAADTPTTDGSQQKTANGDNTASTAPLSGGQEEIDTQDDDEEETIVRGFTGNAVKTENGIQYLGKRLAKYVLGMTYPDQPFLPVKKSLSRSFTDSFRSQMDKANRDGKPSHHGSSVHLQKEQSQQAEALPYKITSISFIGHSLGGLIQTYAIAYIHKHSPTFFTQIEPINFITMAAPMLGLSNENPMYVRFALDFGLVGRTGQDLGLTWRPPTLAKGGWNAVIAGLGNSNAQKDQKQPDPGSKPLLRILPTGPAHQVLRMFRNRTLYSNVVNDGIVPLRTSCLLFLDWRGLGKVEKARRGNGLIGTMAEWGWAELTGASMSTVTPNVIAARYSLDNKLDEDEDNEYVRRGEGETVPQPSENETADDNKTHANRLSFGHDEAAGMESGSSSPGPGSGPAVRSSRDKGMLDNLLDFFRSNPSSGATSPRSDSPYNRSSKRQLKALRRAQTVGMSEDDLSNDTDTGAETTTQNPTMRPHLRQLASGQGKPKRPVATKGESFGSEENEELSAPPKTSIFESAGDILHPPLPSLQWITDPSTRPRTIFHDRVYHPEDIPPPPLRRQGSRLFRTISNDKVSRAGQPPLEANGSFDSADGSGMKVEEKIARAYHHDLSWRKVLVRLEPDAHNNMIVRRMFANAYGWPVIKHLCDTHFANTYAAQTRDEAEPAKERAPPLDQPVPAETGEEVTGQTDQKAPDAPQDEMREAQDELTTLKRPGPSPQDSQFRRHESAVWDDSYLEGSDDDSDIDERHFMQKLINPQIPKKPEQAHHRPPSSKSDDPVATPTTPYTDGHRGLAPLTPTSTKSSHTQKASSVTGKVEDAAYTTELVRHPEPVVEAPVGTAEVGLRRSLNGSTLSRRSSKSSRRSRGSVVEAVAKMTPANDATS